MKNSFDHRISLLGLGSPKDQLMEVGDTCETALMWFRDHDIQPSAADVLKFAEMVLSRWDGATGQKQWGAE